jgi:hypothetical protein
MDGPPSVTSSSCADEEALMNSTVDLGQRVRVHVNLHRQRLSVIDPRTRLVITYVDDITLTRVEFRYQLAGVRRVQQTGVRAVCAYAVGIVDAVNSHPPEVGRRVTYNPFRRPDFHDAITGETVTHADRVVFIKLRAYKVA